MSRIGRMPITLPQGVEVSFNQNEVTVKGPRGQLNRSLHPDMVIEMKDNSLVVSRASDNKENHSIHGLTRTLLANMVEGVSRGFEKRLEIVGVGYRAEGSAGKLIIRVGYSSPVEVSPMPGVSLNVEGAQIIKVSGTNKELVGEMAARIRAIRPPDSYKGKGIRYAGEVIHLKAGKAGKTVGKRT